MLATMYRFSDSMSDPVQITRVDPAAGISGGEVTLTYTGVTSAGSRGLGVLFDAKPAHLTAVGRGRALVSIPELSTEGGIEIVVLTDEPRASSAANFLVGRKLTAGVHPVANPAFDPSDGSLYVTRSGSRGERVPVSIFRITREGTVEDFSSEVMNPTSIAFGRTQRMFVTSRFEGTVYRVTAERQMLAFASDLGVATGLAFNSDGEMFVGDRGGTIFRVNEIGEAKPWAQHEPSVSAYHLAFGPDGSLYLSGPTVSSFDSITRFDEDGNASPFYQGLGRPQGLAFDRAGNLYVAASLRGRRGIVRISPDGSEARLIVAGMNIVGLAFGPDGEMVVTTNEAVYTLPLEIQGALLS
jgi:sugar lactone lactonase YvrE